MKERIIELRRRFNLTQQAFADRLNIKRGAVANYEVGRNEPSDSVVALICREFGVREEWLRDGVEPMFGDRSREEALGAEVARLMSDAPDSFKAALISTLLRYDPDGPEWAVLEAIYRAVAAETEKDPE